MSIPLLSLTLDSIFLNLHQVPSAQPPTPSGTTLILLGALLLVLIILGGVLWVTRRRK